MADFTMPALGADMETGKVVQWLVKAGDRVRRGDVVAVVETHKGAIDVEIFLDGVIGDLAPLDEQLPVGALLAHVQTDVATQRRASSAAQQRARELGIDVGALRGSGIDGAVTLADVERAAAATTPHVAPPSTTAPHTAPPPTSTGHTAPPPPKPRRGFDPAPMRSAIAAAMARSKREIPHYYLVEPIAMRAALDWLHARNATASVTDRLLPAVLLIKAVALALKGAPQLNGHFIDGRFEPSAAVHVGVAIALRGGGLIAPALHDVQDKPLPRLMAELADLVQRARSGGIRSSELTDPTITVTNLGDQGVESVLGVIYPPQVALVGFGRIAERAWVHDGGLMAMPVVQASLAADHRVSDGHGGALFLAALAGQLQQPEAL